MTNTSEVRRLAAVVPESQTHWRTVAAAAHRAIGGPGAEAAARTHENLIHEVRSAGPRGLTCKPCARRGVTYLLLFMGGSYRCGTCGWLLDTRPNPG